jgi:uncharacterized protein YcbX
VIEIAELNVYPVKSCRGMSLAMARLTGNGLELDRNWMFVDEAGNFVTQRQVPALALVEPRIEPDGLVLGAPAMAPLALHDGVNGRRVRVSVWNDQCDAFDEGEEAAAWITHYPGFTARLVRFDPQFRRLSDRAWTGDVAAANRFSDGFPLLVLSKASIRDVGRRLGTELPANRFRPNIVISGVEPYDEDHIELLSVAEVMLKLVKPCSRCQIVNTDQRTGAVGEEPLLTLATYRRNERLQGAVTMGQNAVIVNGVGSTLRVGDSLHASWTF